MTLVELPIEISLRVDRPYQRLPKANAIRTDRPFNIESYLLHNHPGRIWYQAAGDVVVGVPGSAVSVREERSGTVAVRAARARIRELVKGATAFQMTRGPQWSLPHDFRKLTAEVMTMSRLLSELSILVAAAAASAEAGSGEYAALFDIRSSSSPVRPAIIRQLLSGRSIYELQYASMLRNPRLARNLLLFETLNVSIESPFFARLKAYLQWDKKVKIGDIIAAAALALALGAQLGGNPNPQKPVKPDSQINWVCQASPTVSQQSDVVYRESLREYQEELRKGGVKTAQRYLFMLGYNPGLFDGKDGPETGIAVAKFCDSEELASQDVHSKIFLRHLAEAVARKFPIRESK